MDIQDRLKADAENFGLDTSTLDDLTASTEETIEDDFPEVVSVDDMVAKIAPDLTGVDESTFPQLLLKIIQSYEDLKLWDIDWPETTPAKSPEELISDIENL